MKQNCKPQNFPVLATLILVALISAPCVLQAKQAPQEGPADLPASAQTVLKRLDSFSNLPEQSWRYHEGNLPHGESPMLNDASWRQVKRGAELPRGSGWLRAKITVPDTLHGYDLTGTTISFAIDISGNGPRPLIIYFNGRRVAMGDDLEPITLFQSAKPGDSVLVAVKMLYTEDQKTFRGSQEAIQFSTSRPNPEVLRREAASAAILLPAIDPGDSKSVATLDQSVKDIDVAALDQGNQSAFDASLKKAQAEMMTLRPILQRADIHLTGNSHIDAAWLWPWEETTQVVRDTFGTVLQLMDEYPDYTYSASAAAYYKWLQDMYPDEFKQIQQRIKEGRWEPVGGMWIEPDLNMPSGESQVRQLLLGERYFEKNLGVFATIGWNPDSFGYNWQLPQIYKRSGLEYFVTQKMSWNDTNKLPLKIFWWESPDGSKILTYFPEGYANPIKPIQMAKDFAAVRKDNPGATEIMHLYGVGDHGGGPTRAMLDAGVQWMNPDKAYAHVQFGSALSFFQSVQSKLNPDSPVWNYKTLATGDTALPKPPAGEISLPTWNDELYLEFHRGTYTSQARHKKNMRRSEEEVLNAEKWSSLAWLSGSPYPQKQLNRAWDKVLFNEFHDLAAGSGIAAIYKAARQDYRLVGLITHKATNNAFDTISSYIDTKAPAGEAPILVFNPLSWNRTDVADLTVQMPAKTPSIEVVDAQGKPLVSEVSVANPDTNSFHVKVLVPDVPSMGYEEIYARPVPSAKSAPSGLTANGFTLENKFVKVTVDPKTGCITSLIDRKTNFNAIASGACGNVLETFKDLPKEYDAWNIGADYAHGATKLESPESVKLVTNDPLRAVIRVTHHWDKSTFVQDITLYAGLPYVEVVNNIDWHEKHIMLKASMPLAASNTYATFEIPYGSIERPTTRNNSFTKAKWEVSALRWADEGNGKNGLSFINNCKYGYDSLGNLLRLTLLRSPTWPDPNTDQGHHTSAYALYPHAGTWKQALTVRQGRNFNYRLEAFQPDVHGGSLPKQYSFLGVKPDNVVVTAMKKTEDGNGLLIRFYEWAGKSGNVTLTLPPGIQSATLANLMEKPLGGPLSVSNGSEVTVPVTKYEIQTVIVHYGEPNQNFLMNIAEK